MQAMEVYFTGGLKVEADYKGFTFKTDQGIDSGGEGLSPDPFSLFLAAIGTCAGFYILNFCKARDIKADDIRLIINFEKAPAEKLINNIYIDIILPLEFPDKYREAIITTAKTCMVAKHLQNPPNIHINIKS